MPRKYTNFSDFVHMGIGEEVGHDWFPPIYDKVSGKARNASYAAADFLDEHTEAIQCSLYASLITFTVTFSAMSILSTENENKIRKEIQELNDDWFELRHKLIEEGDLKILTILSEANIKKSKRLRQELEKIREKE